MKRIRASKKGGRFDVFTFADDDEKVEKESAKILGKFKIPKTRRKSSSPLNKYNFLKCFARENDKSNNRPIDVDVDVEATRKNEISNRPIELDIEDPPKEQLSVCGSEGQEIGTENVKVVISPDFVFHRGNYCTEGQLTFSKNYLKFEGLTVNGTGKKFSSVWSVDDIISINAEWSERMETAIMNLVLQSKNSKRAGNANETSVIGLNFSVCDPCWSKRQEAIKSLSVRYKDMWNTISDENDEIVFMGQSSKCLSKQYFSEINEDFEEVIYRKDDPDAVSISKRDVALLQPETFINDTIIDFYIQYLKNKIQPEEQHRFHFFNSFFFRKLADLDKGLSSACQAREAFQRVCKWTRKVDIFEKDYIFIPVNYSLHWSLIVICHPGEVANFKDDEAGEILNIPCILHMNSIRGSHRGLKNLFRSYLFEEWKERHTEVADDVASKFLHLQFVSLELPQQENSFDCGLFLLHYLELFLRQASSNFCPLKLNKYWFPPAEASLKRYHIKKLIYEILREQSFCSTSTDSLYKYPSSLLPGQSEREAGLQFIKQIGSSEKSCYGHSSNSVALSPASPPIVLRSREDSGLENFNCYEVGTSEGLLSHGNHQQINARSKRNAMSPIEEKEETSEEIAVDSPLHLDDEQISGSVMRYTSKKFRLRSWDQEKPLHFEDLTSNNSSRSLESSERGLEDDQLGPEFEVSSHQWQTNTSESSSTSVEGYWDCIVEDSQESGGTHDDIESSCVVSPFQRDISALSHQQADLSGKIDLKETTVPVGENVSEDVEQPISNFPEAYTSCPNNEHSHRSSKSIYLLE